MGRKITLVADDKLPFIEELFGDWSDIRQKPGASIGQQDLVDAQVLLTRSITPINEKLLTNTAVEFIASATAGCDHIDQQWLKQNGIRWCHAPGANAMAVAEYVRCCIAYLRQQQLLPAKKFRAAVIGVGHVGTQVVMQLQHAGASVLQNDPPRAEKETHFYSTPLGDLVNVDLICVHTPLTRDGKFPTDHLINNTFLSQLKPGCVLLNAGRGAVVDEQALLNNKHVVACLDVFDNEPDINLDLVQHAAITTPHIAGYSQQAKRCASEMIYHQFAKHFNISVKTPRAQQQKPDAITDQAWLNYYNPADDMNKMRQRLSTDPANFADNFEKLRREYRYRG